MHWQFISSIVICRAPTRRQSTFNVSKHPKFRVGFRGVVQSRADSRDARVTQAPPPQSPRATPSDVFLVILVPSRLANETKSRSSQQCSYYGTQCRARLALSFCTAAIEAPARATPNYTARSFWRLRVMFVLSERACKQSHWAVNTRGQYGYKRVTPGDVFHALHLPDPLKMPESGFSEFPSCWVKLLAFNVQKFQGRMFHLSLTHSQHFMSPPSNALYHHRNYEMAGKSLCFSPV